ncbi:tetratricopeptide repeat protein [Chloroflexota bacterium]
MRTKQLRLSVLFGLIALLLTIILRWPFFYEQFYINRLALLVSKQILLPASHQIPPDILTPPVVITDCSSYWLQGFLVQEDQITRNRNWAQAIICDKNLVVLLHELYPADIEMAQMALQEQPSSAESWFWAGDLIPEKKLEYYRQGLELSPRDGLRWMAMGNLLSDADLQAAMQAYLQACLNGDPGAHGCQYAGVMAEQLGDYELAIQYYRLSRNTGIRSKADKLEAQLETLSTP